MENVKSTTMWELCVYASPDFMPFYQSIRAKIKSQCHKSAMAYNEIDNNFLFAVEKEFCDVASRIIKSQIRQYLLKKEKIKYFTARIQYLTLLGELEPIFLKLLELFEFEADCLEIEKYLKLDKELHLSEFFAFMCKSLTKKWQEICDMTNENNFFFSSKELTFQLLRFLLNNCKRKSEELILIKDDANIYIYNKCSGIAKFDASEDEHNGGNKIVTIILDNLPSMVTIKDKRKFDRDFIGLLDLIFKNSLKFVD